MILLRSISLNNDHLVLRVNVWPGFLSNVGEITSSKIKKKLPDSGHMTRSSSEKITQLAAITALALNSGDAY